jgi:type IV fimbrial biogenesis protein FimT
MPFVRNNEPFVCSNGAHVDPFVSFYMPFVRFARGFTLIELFVTIVVVSIIAGIALPSFRPMLQNMRIRSEASDLAAAINLGRSEAIKLQTAVIICVRSGTTETCGAGSNWASGWLLFVDKNGDGNYAEANDLMLRAREAVPGGLTLTNNLATTPGSLMIAASGKPAIGGSFRICDNRAGTHGRLVDVARTGRVNVSQTSCP